MNNPAVYIDPLGLFGPGDIGNFVQDRGDDLRDAGGDVVEFADEHVVQPTVDFLSDPENLLSAAQIGSGLVAQVACKAGQNVVCDIAFSAYVVASAGKWLLADSSCEKAIVFATAVAGNPLWPAHGKPAYLLAGFSGAIDGVGCPAPVYAAQGTRNKE